MKFALIGNKKLFNILKNYTHTHDIDITYCVPKTLSIINNYDFFKTFDIILEQVSSDTTNRNLKDLKVFRLCPFYFPMLNIIPRWFEYDPTNITFKNHINELNTLKNKLKRYLIKNMNIIKCDYEYSLYIFNYGIVNLERFKIITGIHFFDFLIDLQYRTKTKILFSFKPYKLEKDNSQFYNQLISFCKTNENFKIISERPIQYIKHAKYSFSMDSRFILESLLLYNKPAFYIKNLNERIYEELGESDSLLNNNLNVFKNFYISHSYENIHIPKILNPTLSSIEIQHCDNWLYHLIKTSFREGMKDDNTDKIDELILWIKSNSSFENCRYENPVIEFEKLFPNNIAAKKWESNIFD